ncbi:restriction endonuclease subunit S [Vibrio aphrogenes]|uniref:restriction endonuclease subunit S n=1 Tax=Vibrio aphrogenes TaxID=1891186 RepID=UPI000B34B51E|nr:restriction endonuclease subunit S [Vibrio aphrogenes]
MQYPNYPEYITSRLDSNIEIPKSWEEKRLKFIASHNDESLPETTPDEFEMEYIDISSVDLIKGIQAFEITTFEQAPSRARRLVKNGDTIVSTVRTYLKAIAPIKDVSDNTIVSTGFAVIRPREDIDAGYLSYFLQNQNFVELVVANSVGVSYPAINASDLVCIPAYYPKRIEEQEKIASFLDYKTQQIDQLIEKKKELIEKLEEQRIAIITQAVTKGIDENAKLKPSGVDWLGDVPEHWEISKIRWFIKVGSGDYLDNVSMEAKSTVSCQIPVIGGNGLMAYTSIENTSENALVVGRVGAHCGNVHLVRTKSWVTDNALRIKIIDSFDQDYLYWLLRTMKLNDDANKNAQPLITGETIKSRTVPIPPIENQLEIVRYIEVELAKLSLLEQATQLTIEKLEEYRSALITSAVTGKIDVREIELPKEFQ